MCCLVFRAGRMLFVVLVCVVGCLLLCVVCLLFVVCYWVASLRVVCRLSAWLRIVRCSLFVVLFTC